MSVSGRECQIVDVLLRVTADDPPGYSAVRATLRVMEEKGTSGTSRRATYVYLRKIAPERAWTASHP